MKVARRARALVSVVLFAGLFLSVSLSAQPADEKASDRAAVVSLELRIGDDEPVRISLGMLQPGTLRSPHLDGTWLVVPVAADRLTDEVTLRVSKAIGTRADGLVVAGATEVALYRDFRQPLAHLPIDVRVLEVRRVKTPTRPRITGLDGAYLKNGTFLLENTVVVGYGDCCVSCGSTTICGCEVELGCGQCCTWCCSGGGPWAK